MPHDRELAQSRSWRQYIDQFNDIGELVDKGLFPDRAYAERWLIDIGLAAVKGRLGEIVKKEVATHEAKMAAFEAIENRLAKGSIDTHIPVVSPSEPVYVAPAPSLNGEHDYELEELYRCGVKDYFVTNWANRPEHIKEWVSAWRKSIEEFMRVEDFVEEVKKRAQQQAVPAPVATTPVAQAQGVATSEGSAHGKMIESARRATQWFADWLEKRDDESRKMWDEKLKGYIIAWGGNGHAEEAYTVLVGQMQPRLENGKSNDIQAWIRNGLAKLQVEWDNALAERTRIWQEQDEMMQGMVK